MKTKHYLMVVALGLAVFFTSCKEDDPPPYVGTWETDFVTADTTMPPIKLVFTFQETTFTLDVITQIGPATFPALGVKGTIVDKGDMTVSVSITDLGVIAAEGGYTWYNKETAASMFYGIFNSQVKNVMPLDFDATYTISGKTMDFYIELAQQTIKLHRI